MLGAWLAAAFLVGASLLPFWGLWRLARARRTGSILGLEAARGSAIAGVWAWTVLASGYWMWTGRGAWLMLLVLGLGCAIGGAITWAAREGWKRWTGLGTVGIAVLVPVMVASTFAPGLGAGLRRGRMRSAARALIPALPASPNTVASYESVLPDLTQALRSPDPLVRGGAADYLGDLGRAAAPAVQELTKLTQDPDLEVRRAAESALTSIHALER